MANPHTVYTRDQELQAETKTPTSPSLSIRSLRVGLMELFPSEATDVDLIKNHDYLRKNWYSRLLYAF